MKIRLTFKTPEVLFDTLDYTFDSSTTEEEKTKVIDTCNNFVRWGEYATIEIDTETQTAVVIPV